MQKLIFGVFAHPDDEAFGPCGTLLKEVDSGNEVHLITLTAGEAGRNPDNLTDIASVRLDEWRAAGEHIGVSSQQYLGFTDGRLDNTSMIEITERIEQIIRAEIKDRDVSYELLAYDLTGLSGHIDHIVASRSTAAVFYRLKSSPTPPTRMRLFCLSETAVPEPNVNWVFMEAGRSVDEIDEVVDASNYAKTIREIIQLHHSQREDAHVHLGRSDEELSINNFRVRH